MYIVIYVLFPHQPASENRLANSCTEIYTFCHSQLLRKLLPWQHKFVSTTVQPACGISTVVVVTIVTQLVQPFPANLLSSLSSRSCWAIVALVPSRPRQSSVSRVASVAILSLVSLWTLGAGWARRTFVSLLSRRTSWARRSTGTLGSTLSTNTW